MDWSQHIRRILAHLGEDVTFTHAGGSPVSVRGMFVSPYAELLPGIGAGIDGSKPHFAAMTADLLPSVAEDDTIVRGALTYKVKDIQAQDPGGFTLLQLEKQ